MQTQKVVAPLMVILWLVFSHIAFSQTPNDDLIKACGAGDLAKVKTLIEGGANVNFRNEAGATPISSAFMWPEVTEFLLGKNADANGGDYPALVNAANSYSVDVIKLLLKVGADPNKIAVLKVDLAGPMRKLLADEKAKGKKGNKYMVKAYEDQIAKLPPNNTLMYSALSNALTNTNCEECVELLLNAGAKTDFKNSITGGNSVHDVAFNWQPVEARAARIKAIVDYYEKASLPVPEWYKNLDVSNQGSADGIIKLLVKKGADMEFLDNNKRTPLTTAVLQPIPNEEVIMALIDNGASLKAAGKTNDVTEFQNETAEGEKIKVKFDFPGEGRNSNNGSGYSANMDLVNPKPKKVALISYYLYDAGKGKANITGTATWVTSESAGQSQVNGFYAKSIQAYKDAFKQNGIDLLTPNEFLDTQEKAELYYGFIQESAKKEHLTLTRTKTRSSSTTAGGWTTTTYRTTTSTSGTLKVSPTGAGYRTFFVANENEDESAISNFQGGIFTANRKLTSSLGYELCKGLGVDAVLVVYIATRKPKQIQENYGVNAVVTIMLGPNPGKTEATDPEAKNLGQFYCGTRTYYGSPVIFKESKGIFGQYDGMANVLKAHAAKMCKYVNGKEKDSD
jgi:ankyrin repeat protein